MKKLVPLAILLCSALYAKSQTGLDPGFANGGIGIYAPLPNSQAQAIAVQGDGKIIIAGLGSANPSLSPVIRLNPNGTPDGSFNGTGTVLIATMNTIESIAIQPDGKIVMAGIGFKTGTDYNVFMIVRLNADGSYDNTFGVNGIVYVDIVFGVDYGQALALAPDGKIVVAGNSQIPGGDFDISIIRLLSNGTLDNSFDGDGKMVVERNGTTEFESGLVVQPDGKIIIEGKTYLSPDSDLMIARINAGGGLDNSFGVNGVYTFEEIDGYEPYFGKTMVLQPDGKILIGRNSYIGDGITKFIAIRINPDGTPDNGFDSDGYATVSFGGTEEICTSIALQGDGKIVLSGYSIGPAPNRSDFALARLNSDGSLDNCFNQTGKLVIPRTDWDEAVDMILQPDGKILVTGYTVSPSTSFIAMRIQSSGGTGEDLDGDGYTSCNDCNDNNPAIHPGATEICNNTDDDCDGFIDEGVRSTYYRDLDGDTYGDPAVTIQACTLPPGYVSNSTDCNDSNTNIHPGAPEICNSIDDDCNGQVDEGVQSTFYRDFDSDGFGDPAKSTLACNSPAGYVINSTDCNDNDATIHPGALENSCNGVDNDCDGQVDEDTQFFTYYFDGDGDGWGIASQTIQACAFPAGYAVNPGDCNDNNPTIHPAATELCNGIDEDCDGVVDDGALHTYFKDNDGDGYGNNTETIPGCSPPLGYVIDGNDCNDANASIHPGAAETCNGVDDDCDGIIDEGLTLNDYYRDFDGDGYGVMIIVQACSLPAGYATQSGDCNENDPNIHPGATEICNSIDDDCDGQIDESLTTNWYRDNDGDGFGDPNALLNVCFQPAGYVTDNTDCVDTDPTIHPGATETCNEKDDDCDGQIDEGFVKLNYFRDADGDGYGDPSNVIEACTQPFGYVVNSNDCDDNNDTIHPGATEYCNGIDENCDAVVDDNPVLITWYRDADNDGWGNPNQTIEACTPPIGFIREAFDCNDNNNQVHPGAPETCNGSDDDCDGETDEVCGLDADGDGYTTAQGDCDDNNAAIHPGATEICNNQDDDCDGQVDENVQLTFHRDLDGDGYGDPGFPLQACTMPPGYVDNNTDCNDNIPGVHPGATEVCNNIDDDCDGQVDENVQSTFYRDLDGDGYGDPALSQMACSAPPGYVINGTDCNDNHGGINPGATEICGNQIDDNCNGEIDENTLEATISPAGEVILCNGSSLQLSANDAPGQSYQWLRNNTILVGETGTSLTVTTAGNYSVRITANGNCTAISAVTIVNVQNTPKVGITIQGSGNNCPLTLQAHPGGQVTYQWYRNNILLVGATQRNYSATTSGSYSVTVTRDGCTGIAPPVTITTCPPIVTREYTRNTSEPLPVLDKIRIHPNPASEYFITELDLGEVINEEATIELLTLTGTIVTTQKTRIIHGRIQYRMRLDGYWTENVYLVRITTTKRVFTAKLLIIRS